MDRPPPKTYLEQLETDKTSDGRPVWAPKPNQTRQLNHEDLVYLAKIKALSQFSDKIQKKNMKLRYRLNSVSKEIKLMKKIKRFLCEKLLEMDENIHDERIDFDENDNEQQIDETISEVVTMVMQNPTLVEMNIKKSKLAEMKKRERDAHQVPISMDDDDADKSRQHIISIIESVASEGMYEENKKSRSIRPSHPSKTHIQKPSSSYTAREGDEKPEKPAGIFRLNYNGFKDPEAQNTSNYDALSTPLREVLKIAQGRKPDHGGVTDAWLALIQTSSMSPKTSSLSPPATARSRLSTFNSISSAASPDRSTENNQHDVNKK
ncbi:unnamed protein product [Bursaphelenchus xylophilus]|uniref:(pine wood nematode) hypothetical protein n=1 Tax=Bursaphelenchus xylophilus TaxID=6326 RepID=A0A1I7SPZ8_BURXY|nr:unnamed protein product [Bursaphelenchus xylophilus]CAG9109414.1 unnamed protein product [Bursaphelenchus xylophilus]